MTVNNSLLDIIARYCRKSGYIYSTIKLKVDSKVIGAIQSISYSLRDDKHFSITASRIRLDHMVMQEVFLGKTLHPSSQKMPIQIEIDDGFSIVDIENAWICSIGTSFQIKDYMIMENVKLEAETMTIKKGVIY